MRQVELVRCTVTSPREPGRAALRYVPSGIFDLWKYMMEHRHGFAVAAPLYSTWFDAATYAARKDALPPHAAQEVIEVRFRYPGPTPAGREVLRYFPAGEYGTIQRYLAAHFDPARSDDAAETAGVFVVPR